jgi:hypothetical protein
MKFPVRMRSRISAAKDPVEVSINPAAPAIEGRKVGNEHKINPNALQAYLIKKSSNILYPTRAYIILISKCLTLKISLICFINLAKDLFKIPISISEPL